MSFVSYNGRATQLVYNDPCFTKVTAQINGGCNNIAGKVIDLGQK